MRDLGIVFFFVEEERREGDMCWLARLGKDSVEYCKIRALCTV